jgi:hypothetical protein
VLILKPSRNLRLREVIIKTNYNPFKTLFAWISLMGASTLMAADASRVNLSDTVQAPARKLTQEEELEMPDLELTRKGPWGQLEYFEALLEAPLELIKANQPNSLRTRWFFSKMEPDAVDRLLSNIGLGDDLLSSLRDKELWTSDSDGTALFPRLEQIRALPEASRISLYRVLSKWQENPFHVEPEVLHGESVKKWLEGFSLSEETVAFIEAASYSSSKTRLFADVPAVLSMAKSEEERMDILRALNRTPTLVAKLCMQSTSAGDLSAYWNQGARNKDSVTFLDSMLKYPSFEKIDLVHMLPANVRKILYTFPNSTYTRSGYLPDCHWSALNFFNEEPLERLSDPPQATAYTLENFVKVDPPYQLGDVLFFTDSQTGDAYHSCAYIADDIVFTKNGRSPLQPWILMKLDKVKNLYDLHFRTDTTAYRRKR